MARILKLGLGLALMSVCLAKANDAGAAPPPDKPTVEVAGDTPLAVNVSTRDVATIEAPAVDPAAHAALQTERDKLADDLARLGNFLHEAGFVSESGGPESDIDVAIHHLGLKKGYMDGIEASAGILDNFQSQIERLANHILAVAPDVIEGSAVDTAIKLIDDRAALQLALETAQARAKREVEEALTGDGTEQAETPDTEIRHIRGRRRLVPRAWPAG